MRMESTNKGAHKQRSTNGLLSNYILKVMAPGAHMRLVDIQTKIIEAGYVPSHSRFSSTLHAAITNKNTVRKVSRGVYVRVCNLVQEGRDRESE